MVPDTRRTARECCAGLDRHGAGRKVGGRVEWPPGERLADGREDRMSSRREIVSPKVDGIAPMLPKGRPVRQRSARRRNDLGPYPRLEQRAAGGSRGRGVGGDAGSRCGRDASPMPAAPTGSASPGTPASGGTSRKLDEFQFNVQLYEPLMSCLPAVRTWIARTRVRRGEPICRSRARTFVIRFEGATL